MWKILSFGDSPHDKWPLNMIERWGKKKQNICANVINNIGILVMRHFRHEYFDEHSSSYPRQNARVEICKFTRIFQRLAQTCRSFWWIFVSVNDIIHQSQILILRFLQNGYFSFHFSVFWWILFFHAFMNNRKLVIHKFTAKTLLYLSQHQEKYFSDIFQILKEIAYPMTCNFR